MTIDKGAHVRIATEEAFATTEILDGIRRLMDEGAIDEPGFFNIMGYFLKSDSERAHRILSTLVDLDDLRLSDMDDTGIAMQVISMTAPGVQLFEADEAVGLAASSNDQLAAAVRRHPDRFAGLATIAPQDPAASAAELGRAVRTLGLKGAIINSHTHGEFLDDKKFWDIFEAAESLDVPIYLHPTSPPKAMIEPFLSRGLDGAVYGFAVETSVHALRMIVGGVFDRFPNLKIVVGHLGEGLPFFLYRFDYMHASMVRSNRYQGVKALDRPISERLKENFYFTSSGMPWAPAVLFTREVIGADRVMYAMDYPYEFVTEEVEMSDALPLSAEEMSEFYEGVARRVFSL
jgi:5-carboxyvanillate decarboxylase